MINATLLRKIDILFLIPVIVLPTALETKLIKHGHTTTLVFQHFNTLTQNSIHFELWWRLRGRFDNPSPRLEKRPQLLGLKCLRETKQEKTASNERGARCGREYIDRGGRGGGGVWKHFVFSQ